MRWVLLGASSGLGKAFLKILIEREANLSAANSKLAVLSLSRTAPQILKPLGEIQGEATLEDLVQAKSFDFSKVENWGLILDEIESFQPDKIVYFAGGGPYGPFAEKKFADHQWAMRVTFEFPAFLLHRCLERLSAQSSRICQIIFIGSSIAEREADPLAASYCAGKHALKGLIDSVQAELAMSSSKIEDPVDVQIFSPGYMNTRMLPPRAWPRQNPGLVKEPEAVATELYDFLESPLRVR